jgi:phage terminase large subunit GpA-like protein
MTATQSLEQIVAEVAALIRPPERLTVWQAAEKYVKVYNPGFYVGPWDSSLTPYMKEPMEVLTSDEYTQMIFVGPAQSGKTDMFKNWLAYTALCDPTDMILYHTGVSAAKDYSEDTITKLIRHSPAIAEAVSSGSQAQSLYRIDFKSTMRVRISWVSINEMSSRTVQRVFLSDYDRMDQNVDGEGSPHDLATARTTVYKDNAMCVSESTPGFELTDPNFIPKTPHQAPPVEGILALYNRGDRRRFYWQCQNCDNWFEPHRNLLRWDEGVSIAEAVKSVHMECPHCEYKIYHDGDPERGIWGKREYNKRGIWLKDGQSVDKEGNVRGKIFSEGPVASFWVNGVVAGLTTWEKQLDALLKAEEEFKETGSQEALKVCINTKFGEPYTPRGIGSERLPEVLKSRAEAFPEKTVPRGVRFLIATIDVQRSPARFEVQVHGFGEGKDMYIIDRFAIKKSKRLDQDGDHYFIMPQAYLEDWQLLIEQVLEKAYPLEGEPNKFMAIKAVGCDSGGQEGVTSKAYEFYRYLKYEHVENPNLYKRFILLKGSSSKEGPRQRLIFPDSGRKDSKAEARGEIPVLLMNTYDLKNMLDAMLDRKEPKGGMVHFPKWLPSWFYEELCAERRTAKGWERVGRQRNEAWDLCAYALAVAISKRYAGLELIDWDYPPSWAEEWEENDLVFEGNDKKFDNKDQKRYNIAELAKGLT